MQSITLEVILRAVFGVRGEERLARFRATLPQLTEASGVVMWLPFMRHNFGPWSPWARFLRMRRAVDALVYEEIRQRRADPDRGGTRRRAVGVAAGAARGRQPDDRPGAA